MRALDDRPASVPDETEKVAGGRGPGFAGGHFVRDFADTDHGAAKQEQEEPGRDLLRAEAMDAMREAGHGRPIAQMPMSWRMMTMVLLALLVAIGLLLAFTSFERREIARGVLRAKGGEAQIFVPERGVIRELLVREGELVKRNQPLMVVGNELVDRGGGLVRERMLNALAEQEESLDRRLALANGASALDAAAASARRVQLEAALTAAQATSRAQLAQLAMAEEEFERAVPVAERGFISRIDMTRRSQAVIIAKQTVAEAKGRVASLMAQIAELDAQDRARPLALSRDRAIVLEEMARASIERAQIEAGGGATIRASMDGIISSLQGAVGSAVDPGRAVLSITPPKSNLLAVLYVKSSGAGMLRKGQTVRLRYDAFPFQKFGTARGVIKSVSANVLMPERVTDPVQLSEPSYRLEVMLDSQAIAAGDKVFQLRPGLMVTGDIILDRKSLAHWLFEPVLSLRGRL